MTKEEKDILKAWDKLKSGYHNPSIIQVWLIQDMAPAIKKLREKHKK